MDREKIIENNFSKDEVNFYNIDNLNDIGLCKLLILNHSSNTLNIFATTILNKFSLSIIILQFLILGCLVYFKLTGDMTNEVQIMLCLIVILCHLISKVLAIIISKAKFNALLELTYMNTYLTLLHNTILDDINKNENK